MNIAYKPIVPVIMSIYMLLISGCTFPEPRIFGFGERQRILIKHQYAGYEEIRQIRKYYNDINTLPKEVLDDELAKVSESFNADPSVVNRIKYALLLVYADTDAENYRLAVSLLDDSFLGEKEAGEFWQFFADSFSSMIDKQLQRVDHENSLLEEKARLVERNQSLEEEIKQQQAELTKFQDQLNQLKSIEASIMERDIGDNHDNE